jgi:hypothetical protein
MAAGNFTSPLVTVANGDIIDATVRNNEFINILANANPTGLSGYQDNLAQKQLQEDPATGLVTSLGKELEQLRFALKRILGETYWYTAPDTDLSAALFSGKAGDVVLGDGTKTTTDPLLTLNANTGDAGIRLQVNNTSANAWDIYNDNSDGDKLKFAYNGTTRFQFDENNDALLTSADGNTVFVVDNSSTGDATLRLRVNGVTANAWDIYNDNSDSDKLKLAYNGGVSHNFHVINNDPIAYVADNIATSTAPIANGLYPHSMVKAWASFTVNETTGAVTIHDAFNVNTISESTTNLTVTFRTNMANTNYAATVSPSLPSNSNIYDRVPHISTQNVGSVVLVRYDISTGGLVNWASGVAGGWTHRYHLTVIGRQ